MSWESRTWVFAEVEAEPSPGGDLEQSTRPGHVTTGSFVVEADGRASDRRVHVIATEYAPNGNYSVRGHVGFGDSLHSEELRFAVPTDEAEAVLGRLRQEPGVRRVWLGDSFRDT